MSHHRATASTSLGVITLAMLTLTSCGHTNSPTTENKASRVIQNLGGDPDRVYKEDFLLKKVGDKEYTTKPIYLVPKRDEKGFQLVDEAGRIYPSYEEFVLDNELTP